MASASSDDKMYFVVSIPQLIPVNQVLFKAFRGKINANFAKISNTGGSLGNDVSAHARD